MPDLKVESDTTLGRLLRNNKGQQWRIPILIKRGGVKAFRGGTPVPLKDDGTKLRAGDLVRLVDPVPKAYLDALQDEANNNSRDYAFVPGTSGFDIKMGKLTEARPETIRINDALIDNLTSFIRALESSALITNPIRNLIVASHANPEGLLFIAMGMLSAKMITYEDLENAVKLKSILLDQGLFLPRPNDTSGTAVPVEFQFRGCRIGSQPAYMGKLKEALGNWATVSAPLHFHIVAQFTVPSGYVEYMGYNFAITKPAKLKDKPAVVAAFDAAGFRRIGGTAVPKKLWSTWIPEKPNLPGDNEYANKVVIPITKAKGDAPRTFRYRFRQLLDSEGSFALLTDTGKSKDRKNALKQELVQLPRYQDTHPFPEFVRFGYKTMDDFMDGWSWVFRYDKTTKTMFYNGSRHEYTLIQPIAEITSDELVMNFYPTTTKGKVIELLKTSDSRFFARV